MKYLLVLLTAVLAGLAWLRPGSTPGWMRGSALALLAGVVGVQLWLARRDSKATAARKYTGSLKAERRLLFGRGKAPARKVELGDSGAIFHYAGPEREPVFRILGDSHLTVELEGNQLVVSTLIRDRHGQVVAELMRNQWKVSEKTTFDRNYSNDALEVRADTGDVVLQVVVLADRIRFAGKFFDERGNGVAFGSGTDGSGHIGGVIAFTDANHPDLTLQIAPLFRYPSELHLGERV